MVDGDKKVKLPIFYDVDPETLKRKSSKFMISFRGWNWLGDKKELEALKEVSGLTEKFILKNYMR